MAKRVPVLGWVSVGAGVLSLVPQVRELAGRRWKPEGWRVTLLVVTEAAVTLVLEAD